MNKQLKKWVRKMMVILRHTKQRLQGYVKGLDKEKRIGLLSILAVMLAFYGVQMLFSAHSAKENKSTVSEEHVIVSQTHDLHKKLSDISIEIAHVQQQLKAGDKGDTQAIEKTLMTLSDEVKTIADSSNTIIEKAIEENTQKLQQQLGHIQTQLTEINDHKDNATVVGADALGFEVIDIFNMDHENIVSVRYGAHTVPLIVGENMAGWKLIHVSFNGQKAEFSNDKNQHVIINLNTPKS